MQDSDASDAPERLTITCELYDRAIVSLDLWEDESACLQFWRQHTGGRGTYRWSFAPTFEVLSPDGIVQALKQTHEHASTAFYGPDYLGRIKAFWGYGGSVVEKGVPNER